jgi:hypothetical protein
MWARSPLFPTSVDRWNLEMGLRHPGLLQWPPARPHSRHVSAALKVSATSLAFAFVAPADFFFDLAAIPFLTFWADQ